MPFNTSQVTSFQGAVAMTSFNSAGQPLGSVRVEKGQASTAHFNQAPGAPVFVPKQELRSLDKSTASAGADSSANASAGSGTTKIGGGVDAEASKDIKVAAADKGPSGPPPLPPGPPPQGPKPPEIKIPRPELPQNTKVTINVN